MIRKVYKRTYWVDHETPVNAENLNKIESALYDLSETTLRPSDLTTVEGGAIILNSNCGKISLEVDKSLFLRVTESLKEINVISSPDQLEDGKENSLYFILDENNNYKINYNNNEYTQVIQISQIKTEDGNSLEDYLTEKESLLKTEVNAYTDKLRSDLITQLESQNSALQAKADELTRKLNNLSVRCDYLESRIKQLEDINDGLEIM